MKKVPSVILSFFFIPLLVCACFGAVKNGKKGGVSMSLKSSRYEIKIASTAFQEAAMIPSKYTCDGENVSPPLEWSGIPDAAKSLALVCDDPDAPSGIWVHWVYYNIPVRTRFLKEAMARARVLEDGSMQGVNDSRNTGYDGPCPPGGMHRYYFRIYALDTVLGLEPGATKAALIKAMIGHVLAEGQLMGRYKKQ